MITIEKAYWQDGVWTVSASVKIGDNLWAGSHQVEGPEDMADGDIEAAILAQYA